MQALVVRDQLAFDLYTNLFAEPANTPPPAGPEQAQQSLAHVWIVAAEIKVEERIAKVADLRGSFTTPGETRVDALEVYCRSCRRPFEDVADTDCAALIDNRHLIGGDQTQRAKRKIPELPSHAKVIPGGKIQRRGISAYVAGVSRPR